MYSHRRTLPIAVLLLLIFAGIRLATLTAIPPFIDEALVLDWSEKMREQSLLYSAGESKLLSVWVLLPFRPAAAGGMSSFWLMRAVVLLITMPGVAALMALARAWRGVPGLTLAGLLLTFSPFHIFMSGMGIAEPIACSFLFISIFFHSRLSANTNRLNAILAGGFIAAAVAAKVAYLTFMVLPVWAAFTLRPAGRLWRKQIEWAVIALGTAFVSYGALLGVLTWRGYAPLNILFRGGGGSVDDTFLPDLLARMWQRHQMISLIFSQYMGIAGAIAVVVLVILYVVQNKPRLQSLFLPGLIFGPGLVVWASFLFFSRYLYAHMALVLVIAALAMSGSRWWRVGLASILVWGVFQFAPFYRTLLIQPELAAPHEPDRAEYYQLESSGSGFVEISAFLETTDSDRVYGFVANCVSLYYLVPQSVTVECPRVSPNGEDIPALTNIAQSSMGERVFIVHENLSYVPDRIPGEVVMTFIRPGGTSTLTVYDMSAVTP